MSLVGGISYKSVFRSQVQSSKVQGSGFRSFRIKLTGFWQQQRTVLFCVFYLFNPTAEPLNVEPLNPVTDTRHLTPRLPHAVHDRFGKPRAFYFCGAFYLTGQIVGNGLGFNRVLEGVANQTGCLVPSHMVQHHGARKD